MTVYLGVNVAGALFAVGDGHARQGHGEVCGIAVEAAMNTVVAVELIKGVGTPWPRLEDDDHLMSTGSARPLEDAYRISQHDLVTWAAELTGLDDARRLPAGQPGRRGAGRQRLRHQLHDGRQDPQVLPGHGPASTSRRTRGCALSEPNTQVS